MDEPRDTSKSTVKTYVPAYQKAEWKHHADELEMSQSEFVRTMVQAGRRGFEPADASAEESNSEDVPPRGDGLETQVLELLSDETYSWEELLEAVTNDVESRLDDTLEELQARNRVRYSGRHGGYTVVGGESDGE
ncbi:DUF5805 domain-containing protein [Natrialbaceae archaeon AArc-T1-2]|uniref:DUF5805 domain-containing protein n=1 Tax=Natrialbaceae archaeon AArc-T1-2 TaxID=3053904 RepID=UPI00255AA35F|nr:DUF5805 domain-containing protein [Natrialbaceae archaeon AArc-T1-2]WIV67267.1 DUF5805 domain-containing protein [Natrialbaceae archaeon AArc-T1-2]